MEFERNTLQSIVRVFAFCVGPAIRLNPRGAAKKWAKRGTSAAALPLQQVYTLIRWFDAEERSSRKSLPGIQSKARQDKTHKFLALR